MKNIFLSILAIALSLSAFSQMELKPAIGFNSSRFDSNPDSLVASSRAGYQVGASLAMGQKIYIEPGLFYTRLNQQFLPADSLGTEFTYNTGYIRVPVNLGLLFIGNSESLASLRIFLGPSMFIPLSVRENTYNLVKDDVKSPQFDFNVGAGLNLWFLFLDVSYGWGLTPQFKEDPIGAKMQAFYASAGFRFKLNRE